MNISTLYRVTSHNQIVDVDDVSMSLDKVSKQIIIFEKELPKSKELNSLLKQMAIGTAIIIDSFSDEEYKPFDLIIGTENRLKVIKIVEIDSTKAVVCLPENFITFFIGQTLSHRPKIFKAKVITLSDRANRGIYKDLSGPRAVELLQEYFKQINKDILIDSIIIPDNKEELIHELIEARNNKTDVLITTGGTGIGKRDITVDTVKSFIGKEIPGIMEMIRVKYGKDKPNALLSRGIAGVMNETLVYTLPGSVKGVEEYLHEIFLTLDHLFYMLHSIDNH